MEAAKKREVYLASGRKTMNIEEANRMQNVASNIKQIHHALDEGKSEIQIQNR